MMATSNRRRTCTEKSIQIHISSISMKVDSSPRKICLRCHLHLLGLLVHVEEHGGIARQFLEADLPVAVGIHGALDETDGQDCQHAYFFNLCQRKQIEKCNVNRTSRNRFPDIITSDLKNPTCAVTSIPAGDVAAVTANRFEQ